MSQLEYRYPSSSLSTGASFGNPYAFARLDALTNVRGLWSSSDNQYYLGEWTIDLLIDGVEVEGKETIFRPTTQSTRYVVDGCTIEKQFLLPFRALDDPALRPRSMRGMMFTVCAANGPKATTLTLRHEIRFPAVASPLFTKQPADDQCAKTVDIAMSASRCTALTRGAEHEARALGSSIPWTKCCTDERHLSSEFTVTLAAGETGTFNFALAFSAEGIADAEAGLEDLLSNPKIAEESAAAMNEVLSRARLTTPDAMINRGVQWAKVNTVRVQHRYRIGEAFTNDPPQDIVVIRDLAWYVFGSNYLTPAFSRSLLRFAEEHGYHEGGKLTEYVHADENEPEKHDYHLNINDDTPLFAIALHHFAMTAGTPADLPWIYSLMKRACEWIMSQMNAGLVWCKTDGTYVWGICGWRNIIDNYTLNGAVTEINAECCRALELTGAIASRMGLVEDARCFGEAAKRMRSAINSLLHSEKTGMYLLNIDGDRERHHDVTGDLIFPPLFGIADEHVRSRILEKLTDDDMWTPYGSRTVSRSEKNYDPDFGYQLVGGLWPNLTAWVAYCIRKEQPAKLIEGMKNIYRQSDSDRPADWGYIVPGQFPERLHGETFKSRGMTMSPWLPPTYLWLAIEGLLGFTPGFERPSIDPAMDPGWTWLAIQNLPWRGGRLTAFVFEERLYTTDDVECRLPVEKGALLHSCATNPAIVHIALKRGNDVLLFVASDRGAEGSVSVEVNGKTIRRSVDLAEGHAVLLRIVDGGI